MCCTICCFASAQAESRYLSELQSQDYVVSGETALVDAAQELRPFTDEGAVGIIFHYHPWEGCYTVEEH